MDSHPNTASRSRVWSAVKWTLAVPILLCGVFALAVGVRYVVGKGRLDRLQPLRDDSLTLHFQQVVPDWMRDWLGDHCEPLDRISAVELMPADDQSLIRVLPNTPDAESVELWIEDGSAISGAVLWELVRLPKLKRLTINGDISHLDLSWLPKCKQLEALSVSITVTDVEGEFPTRNREWCKLLTGLSNLRELTVFDDGVLTRHEAVTLASIPSLRKVKLNSIPWDEDDDEVTDETISWFMALKSLTAESLLPLAAIPNLQSLDFDCEDFSSSITDSLSRFATLRSLTVRNAQLTDVTLRGIAACPQLESLTLVASPVSPPDGLAVLAECPPLHQLILRDNEIGPDHLPGIAKITQLRSLRIEHLGDGIQGLPQLKSLVKLEELDLKSDEPIDEIIDATASMPALHWLRFKTLPRQDHPLQLKLATGTIPPSLMHEVDTAIREMRLQLRIDKDKPAEPTEYSIGERRLLPPDPQRAGFFCFF